MELLTATYCPYCKSWIDIESMLTLANLKEMQFYLTCPECNKTFSTYAKTEIKVNVKSIEDVIEETEKTIDFYESQEWMCKAFKDGMVNNRKERIQELEAIKERNDKEG